MRRAFIAGNWKMHGSRKENAELIEALLLGLPAQPAVDIAVCPPHVYLWEVGRLLKASTIALGAQSVCAESIGAFTGEVCSAMLKDVGCTYVIVGHSERRTIYRDPDPLRRRNVGGAGESADHASRVQATGRGAGCGGSECLAAGGAGV